jgi:bacteriochlorophyll C20 methyltransferase
MTTAPSIDATTTAGTALEQQELFAATNRAYEMVFKGTVDFFVIKAAKDLGLFDLLAAEPRTLADLATLTETVPSRLEKFLITLEQVGLVAHDADRWKLTPFAEQFFADPDRHRNMTMVPFVDYISDLIENYYLRLADVVRGKVDFTSIVPHPPRTREDSLFYETLHRSNIQLFVELLVKRARLAEVQTLVDVGGGIGDIAAALCQAFPNLKVTLINLPSALDLVRENVAAKGLSDRITPVAIDMYRDPYPPGDAVLFSRILYPMNAQFCSMLLKKAYDALPGGGRVLILDMVISDPQHPNYDYLTHYLCAIGMDFSVLEFKDHAIYPDLLRQIGFTDVTFDEGYDHVLYQAVKP